MKKTSVITSLVLAGILVFAVVSCELLAMSIPERISAFETSLNKTPASARNLVQHFHPDMSYRSLWLVDDAFLFTEFAYGQNHYDIVGAGNPSDAGGGRMAVTATLDNDNGTFPIYFEFLEDGPANWKIIYMTCAGDTWGSL